MSYYTNWSDGDLRSTIGIIQMNIREFEEKIVLSREHMNEAQAELDRRALEAYWQAHPGLQLAVGDKLLVTEGYARWIKLGYEAGNVVEIVRIQRVGDEIQIWIPSAIGFGTYFIPLEHARQCRAAWLATQEVANDNHLRAGRNRL